MQTTSTSFPNGFHSAGHTRSLWKRHVVALTITILVVASGWDGTSIAPSPPKAFRDFALVHTEAECLFDHCDPYSADAVMQENVDRRERKVPMSPDELVYPPSTFVLLAPFAHAGWPAAGLLWCWLGVCLFALACAAMVEELALEEHPMVLLPLVALVVSTPLRTLTASPFNSTLHTANPTLVAVPLVAIACLLLLRQPSRRLVSRWPSSRSTLGWVLMGLVLALKPQVAIGPLLALLMQEKTRTPALKAAALAAGVFTVAVLLFRVSLGPLSFLAHMVANNRLALQPGRSSDISMAGPAGQSQLGLQRIAYVFGASAPWPDVLAWSIVALLIFTTIRIDLRNRAWRRLAWCSVAISVLVSVMPVYHGKYDRLMLLAVLPAVAELDAAGQQAIAWLLALTGTFWLLSEKIFKHVPYATQNWPVNQIVPLLLCVFLLWAMAQSQHRIHGIEGAGT